MSDSELVGGIRKGEVDFAVLMERYERRVYRWLYDLVRNAALADEMTECVFIRVNDRLDRFDPSKGSFCTWLHTITYNLVMSHFRQQKHAPESLDAMTEDEAPTVAGPEELYEAKQSRTRLRRAVRKLASMKRRALVGFAVKGEPWRVVAAELGCTERKARYLAMAAATELREEL
jgi:RNA polymerase sigma-70 factor (ECF subfamily)